MPEEPIPTAEVLDLSGCTLGLRREDGRLVVVPQTPRRPPNRIDGVTIGAPVVDGPSPHAGEMHPDGDELLLVLSGRLRLTLETSPEPTVVEIGPGQAVVVPQGVWHQLDTIEPAQMLHITPGPHGDFRPLSPAALPPG